MKIRYNDFEEKTRKVIVDNVQIHHSFECDNTLNIVKNRKLSNDMNKLFQDAESPYLTSKGNNKSTEFVLSCPIHNIDWRIECKSQNNETNMLGIVIDELNFVKWCPENKYCLVLDGVLIKEYSLNRILDTIIEKNLYDKVWVGSLNEFKILLYNQVNKYL